MIFSNRNRAPHFPVMKFCWRRAFVYFMTGFTVPNSAPNQLLNHSWFFSLDTSSLKLFLYSDQFVSNFWISFPSFFPNRMKQRNTTCGSSQKSSYDSLPKCNTNSIFPSIEPVFEILEPEKLSKLQHIEDVSRCERRNKPESVVLD